MKTSLILFTLVTVPSLGFVPQQNVQVMPRLFVDKSRVNDIAHELEDLGEEIKPQVLHETGGFEYTESLIHKLRRDIHEKDVHYRKELEAMQKTLDNIEEQTRAFAVAWETAEVELQGEIKEHKKENDSVRLLLWEAVKLVGRRTGNAANSVLRFLHLKKK